MALQAIEILGPDWRERGTCSDDDDDDRNY